MDTEVIAQLVALALAVLGIIWHQQRQTDKLRDQLTNQIHRLRDQITDVKERLARMEGYLHIGMPAEASARAPRTSLGRQQQPGDTAA